MLLLLCWLGLLGLAAVLWLNPPRPAAVNATPPPAGDLDTAVSSDSVVVALPPLEEYSEIVDRPLFYQARRPPPPADEQPVAAPVAPTEEDELTLIGVMLIGTQKTALIQNQATGKVARLKVGDTLDNWQVVEVEPQRVTLLRRDGESKQLSLLRNQRKPSQQISQQAEKLRRLRELAARRDEAEQQAEEQTSEQTEQQPPTADQPGQQQPLDEQQTDGQAVDQQQPAGDQQTPPAQQIQPPATDNDSRQQLQPAAKRAGNGG